MSPTQPLGSALAAPSSMSKLALSFVSVLVVALGCGSTVSTQQVNEAPNPDDWESSSASASASGSDSDSAVRPRPKPQPALVSNLHLSQTWGEVGSPFESELRMNKKFDRQSEYAIGSLPPGLKFDADKGRIVGVPKQPGFFHVQVAVRQQVRGDDEVFRYTEVGDQWYTEDFELRIYNPITD